MRAAARQSDQRAAAKLHSGGLMLCQRSGVCCITMPVVIVFDGRLKEKPGNVKCPNLLFDDSGAASCAVHETTWYHHTPCFRYGNADVDPDFLGKRGHPCGVGKMLRQRHVGNDLLAFYGAVEVDGNDLVDLGPIPESWLADD